ncbi:TerD family protein [Nocardia sp. NPDC005978]|uniref:TerD family protein n=1 Tax=Nocardia sp. NPDC005978 TaxID=3156725 RepID=UPI0033B8D2EF
MSDPHGVSRWARRSRNGRCARPDFSTARVGFEAEGIPITQHTTCESPAGFGSFTLVDVETSGLHRARDRVLSVAALTLADDGEIVEEFHTLLDPGCDPGPVRIHGLTREKLRGAPRFEAVRARLAELLHGRVMVAHNASFDHGFLAEEFTRAGAVLPVDRQLCTLAFARRVAPPTENFKLGTLAAHYGVRQRKAHDALDDTRVLAGVLHGLMADAGRLGVAVPLLRPRAGTPDRPSRFPIERSARKIPCSFIYPGRFESHLIQGMKIAFTGDTTLARAELLARAEAAGLDVTTTVSRRTSLLVTNDPTSPTGKARAAREHGTPTATESGFLALLPHITPGSPKGAPGTPASLPPRAPASAPAAGRTSVPESAQARIAGQTSVNSAAEVPGAAEQFTSASRAAPTPASPLGPGDAPAGGAAAGSEPAAAWDAASDSSQVPPPNVLPPGTKVPDPASMSEQAVDAARPLTPDSTPPGPKTPVSASMSAEPSDAAAGSAPTPGGVLAGQRFLILGGTHTRRAELCARVVECGGSVAVDISASVTDVLVLPGAESDPRYGRVRALGLPVYGPEMLGARRMDETREPAVPQLNMGAQLTRGQVMDLPAARYGTTWTVRASWKQDGRWEVDLVAFLLDQGEKVTGDADFVFYNQPETAGAVLTVDAPGEQSITLTPDDLPDHCRRVVFAVALDDPEVRFGSVGAIEIEVTAGLESGVLARATLDAATEERTLLLAEVYQRADTWRLRAVGQGYPAGLGELASGFGVVVDG